MQQTKRRVRSWGGVQGGIIILIDHKLQKEGVKEMEVDNCYSEMFSVLECCFRGIEPERYVW